jgi:FG-GAP-like repeat
MTEHLITRRGALRAGAVGIGAVRLAASGSLVGLLVPAGSSAADSGPQWDVPEYVATVPLDSAWFASQIAVADFNGDGHQDILITRNSQDAQHTYPVTVLLGDGKGNFTDGTSSIFQGEVPQTQFARQIVIADFNGDGRPDVFIADHGDDHSPWPGYQNTLILSAPGGNLVDATANLPQVYDFTHSAAGADVNGDGTIDIYEGNVYGANMVPPRVLLNDGTGHFTLGTGLLPAAQTDFNQTQYTGSTFVDVNGDGHPDLILSAESDTPQSVVLLNDGTGHFTLLPDALPPKPFGPDAIGLGPISFDINGDGHPDLLIGYTKNNPFYVGRWIQVLINNSDGTFSDHTSTYLPQSDNSNTWPEFSKLADLQRTGHMDFGVVTNGNGDDSPHLYLRDQNGNFVPGPAIGMSFQAWAFIDAEGDGSNDIIGVTNTGDVWLIPERRPLPLPVLSRFKLTPAAFLAAHKGTSVARHATGTTISYSVSEASTTTFTVDRAAVGASRGRKFIPLHGNFTHRDVAGTNHFHFTGRIGGRALSPGSYRLNATPKSPTGHVGQTKQTPFRIVG